jgi:amino-acid N-acetyltransferase
MVRKAQAKDTGRIHELIDYYAGRNMMLPRAEHEIAENLRDFWVYEKGNTLIGCAALHIFSNKLAEIRSLSVDADHVKSGVGTGLVKACLKEALDMGIKSVFVLTQKSDFFKRFAFMPTEKKKMPQKIWTDCSICPKFAKCDEIAYVKEL